MKSKDRGTVREMILDEFRIHMWNFLCESVQTAAGGLTTDLHCHTLTPPRYILSDSHVHVSL